MSAIVSIPLGRYKVLRFWVGLIVLLVAMLFWWLIPAQDRGWDLGSHLRS